MIGLTLHFMTLRRLLRRKGIKLKEIIHPLRMMLTGKTGGAGMFETMEVLGKQECIKRIEYFLGNEISKL